MKQHWSKSCTKIHQIFRQNIAKIAKKSATRQPNPKIAKFGGKIAHLATLSRTFVSFLSQSHVRFNASSVAAPAR